MNRIRAVLTYQLLYVLIPVSLFCTTVTLNIVPRRYTLAAGVVVMVGFFAAIGLRARFALRHLILLLTLVAVALAIREQSLMCWLRQREAIQTLRGIAEIRTEAIQGGAWIRWLVGDQNYVWAKQIETLTDGNLANSPEHIQAIRNLRGVEVVKFASRDATVGILATLTRVREVRLNGPAITDACIPALLSMRHLERVDLTGTSITSAGFARLREQPRLRHGVANIGMGAGHFYASSLIPPDPLANPFDGIGVLSLNPPPNMFAAGNQQSPKRNVIHNSANGHYYEFVRYPSHWKEAKVAAEKKTWEGLRGHLVTITNRQEAQFILRNFGGTGYAWTGGSNRGPGRSWIWETGPEAGTIFYRGVVDSQRAVGAAAGVLAFGLSTERGQSVGYHDWADTEPNNQPADEVLFVHLNYNGGWADGPAHWGSGFIAEYSD